MLKNLFLLRVNQFVRLINHIGLPVVFLLLLVSLGFILSGLAFLLVVTPIVFFTITIILLFTIHFKRNDLHFLESIAPTSISYKACLFFEYLTILTPFAIFFLWFHKWETLIPVIVTPAITALLPNRILIKKSDTKRSFSILPENCFEIKTHVEGNLLGYGLIGLLGLGSVFHISLFILFTVLLGANILSAFQQLEPKEMVVMSDSFLVEKIKRNIRLTLLWTFPFFSIALLFQHELFYVVIYFYLTLFLGITFAILYKYSTANPLYPFAKPTMAQSLFFMLPYLPGLIIANIGYQFYLWKKANSNLKKYYA